MADRGHKAQRTCLGCRKTVQREELVRYVLSPEGVLLLDYRGKLPGRGAYTCFDPDCIAKAVQRRAFERALRRPPAERPEADTLIAELVRQVRERIVALLGMARKSGVAVSGSNLVLKALDGERIALVLMAEDISGGVAEKIAAKADSQGVCWHRLLDKGRLGQLLGKGERSVVGLEKSSLTETIKSEILRYKQIVGVS